VIYELTSLKPPFLAKNMKELYTKVTKGTYAEIPKHFSKELSKMLSLCLNTNPRLRPTAAELLDQPAFGGSGNTVA
jgi:NIMA (never in mitosis gene a)-related kinase